MNTKQILQTIKGRLEIYVLLVAVAVAVIFNAWKIEDRIGSEVQLVQSDIEAMKEAQEKDDAADSELLEAKLTPIATMGERLHHELELVKANLAGLEVAATDGADARARLLEGRILILQEKIITVQDGQEIFMDSLRCIQLEVRALGLLAVSPPDTVVKVDTLQVEEDRKWWNPFD